MATEPMIDITVKRVFVYRHDTLGWMAWADPPVRSFWCAMRCSGDVPTRRDAARWLAYLSEGDRRYERRPRVYRVARRITIKRVPPPRRAFEPPAEAA